MDNKYHSNNKINNKKQSDDRTNNQEYLNDTDFGYYSLCTEEIKPTNK